MSVPGPLVETSLHQVSISSLEATHVKPASEIPEVPHLVWSAEAPRKAVSFALQARDLELGCGEGGRGACVGRIL